MTIHIEITGQSMAVKESGGMPMLRWPNAFFALFESKSEKPDIATQIQVGGKKPDFEKGELLFHSELGNWKWYAGKNGYVLEVFDARGIRDRARISKDYSAIELWTRGRYSRKLKTKGWVPLEVFNPALEICYLTRLACQGGLLLHAGGVVASEQGLLFAGQSEAGKTTITRFFHEKGFQVLNDERVAVLTHGKNTEVHGTPWTGMGAMASNDFAPLRALFFLEAHHETHSVKVLGAREISVWLMRQCFLPHWDAVAMAKITEACTVLATQIKGYALSFRRDPDVVDFCLAESGIIPQAVSHREMCHCPA